MRGGLSQMQPRNAFSDHGLSYLEPSTALGGLEAHKTTPHTHQLGKSSDTGSPPPTSATTSGSTSTPTSPSTGGLSSSADGQMKHSGGGRGYPTTSLGDGSSSAQMQPMRHQPQNEGNWTVSVPEGHFPQQYPSSPAPVAPAPTEQELSQSPDAAYNPSAYPSAIKLLVSNNVAGSIIGRAGQTISEMQTQSSARIKLSQTGDYYPGTQDRVCLVQGQLDSVKLAVRLLLERFYMLQEQQHSQHLTWQPKPDEHPPPMGFDFVVRLLVPSSSCGMIIGKAGSNIKHMEDASGVSSVRLSPKEIPDPASPSGGVASGTSERIVTLTGPTIETCLSCLNIILDGMLAHQEISRYTNMTTSYSRVVMQGSFGGVPAGPVPGRPLLAVPSGQSPESPIWESGSPYNQFGAAKRSSSSPDLAGQMLWDQRVQPRIPQENPTSSMARPPPSREPMQPYNAAFAEGSHSYAHDMPPMMSSPARGPHGSANPPPVYLFPPSHPNQMDQVSISNSISAPDLLALQLQDSLRINVAPPSGGVDYTHFAPQLPQPTPPGFTAQVLVPDTLIGSILGRGGRTLNELQMHSNTRIRISQRGEYVPGTRNRIVTIRGPTAHSVSLAQYLMSQRMVLPPTAAYSPQAPFHPPSIQQQQQSQPPSHHQLAPHPSHQPQLAHRQDFHPSQYHGSPVESSFQGSEAYGQHPSSFPGSSSNKDLPHS